VPRLTDRGADTSATAAGFTSAGRRARLRAVGIAVTALLVLASGVASLATGPVAIPLEKVLGVLAGAIGNSFPIETTRDSVVILDIRLPRTILAMIVGAATALSGGVMQGLFRNPLADPGIVGISSGAALAAATWVVFGTTVAASPPPLLAGYGLPLAAFAGGLTMTLILHAVATTDGRTSVMTLLLAGIALTGMTSAGIGLLVFVASDQQLREFTFWTLGSLGGATYAKVALVLPFVLVLFALAPGFARALDALSLGESGAFHTGVDVERLKRLAIVGVAAAIGASVAVSGVIAFFGLTIPHLVRLAFGPAHRLLLPVSALGGAAALVLADMVARTIASPAELPLGILTAGVGGPIMLWLLVGRRRVLGG
jgi:iron complex transport system permease protein